MDAYRLTSVSSNFRMSDKAIVAFQKAQTRRFGVCRYQGFLYLILSDFFISAYGNSGPSYDSRS